MIALTVLYPKTDTSRFDMDYYLNQHVPLTRARLTPVGAIGIDLEEGLVGGAPDSPPAYAVIGRIRFNTLEELQTALATHGPELIGDIPNFTDVQPELQISRII